MLTHGTGVHLWCQPRPHPKGGGASATSHFWNLLHARTRYNDDDNDNDKWLGVTANADQPDNKNTIHQK